MVFLSVFSYIIFLYFAIYWCCHPCPVCMYKRNVFDKSEIKNLKLIQIIGVRLGGWLSFNLIIRPWTSLSESLDIRITIEQNKLVWYQNKISKTEQNNSSLSCKGLKKGHIWNTGKDRFTEEKTLKQKDKVFIIDLCNRSEAKANL